MIPVTLTLSGIAGFILSVGMAVDANVLILSARKKNCAAALSLTQALNEGFARAWLSIRDSNASSLITCLVLMWFGTSMVKVCPYSGSGCFGQYVLGHHRHRILYTSSAHSLKTVVVFGNKKNKEL